MYKLLPPREKYFFSTIKYSLLVAFISLISINPIYQSHAMSYDAGKNLNYNSPLTDDLYAAGESIYVDTTVSGDLYLAGANITLNGTVEQDAVLAGGVVKVNANIQDDLRIAGGNVTLQGVVEDDLIITGGNITITQSAEVRGDVVVFGGYLYHSGLIKGNLKSASGLLDIDGKIEGNLQVFGGEVYINNTIGSNAVISSNLIDLGPNALIEGNLGYWTQGNKIDETSNQVLGTVQLDESLNFFKTLDFDDELKEFSQLKSHYQSTWIGTYDIWHLLSALLTMFLIIVFTNKFFKESTKKLFKTPSKSFLLGTSYMIALPVISIFLMISIIGIPLGIIGFISFFITLFLLRELTAIAIAFGIQHYWKKKTWKKTHQLALSFIVYTVIYFLSMTPYLGVFIILSRMILGVFVIGSFIDYKKEIWKKFA